jgi:hypothetical protein
MADESVHPVPWVFGLSIRFPANVNTFPSASSRSVASETLCPPFTRTAAGVFSLIIRAAFSMSVISEMLIPLKTSASGMFGVITRARGKSEPVIASSALSERSLLPLVDTITGSTTMFGALYFFKTDAAASIISASDIIPVFTLSGKISVNMLSS